MWPHTPWDPNLVTPRPNTLSATPKASYAPSLTFSAPICLKYNLYTSPLITKQGKYHLKINLSWNSLFWIWQGFFGLWQQIITALDRGCMWECEIANDGSLFTYSHCADCQNNLKKKVELVSVKNKWNYSNFIPERKPLSKTLLKMEFVFNAIKQNIFESNSIQAWYERKLEINCSCGIKQCRLQQTPAAKKVQKELLKRTGEREKPEYGARRCLRFKFNVNMRFNGPSKAGCTGADRTH